MNKGNLGEIVIDNILVADRHRYESYNLTSLRNDIKEKGLICPIAVKHLDPSQKQGYKLIAGGRRLAVCKDLEHGTIQCHIYSENIDKYEEEAIELAENIEREDLTYAEKVTAVERVQILYENKFGSPKQSAGGQSQKKTAELLGKSRSAVTEDIQLAEAIRQMPELAKCKNKTEALKLLKRRKADMLISELAKRHLAKKSTTPISRQRERLISLYRVGDFFDGIKGTTSRTIHLAEIDPPYGINIKSTKKVKVDKHLTEDYNEVPTKEYLTFMNNVIEETRRVLLPDAWLLLWYAFEPWFEPMFHLLTKQGFVGTRVGGFWIKDGTGQASTPEYHMSSRVESFFYMRQGNAVIQKQGRSNIFDYAPIRPAEKKRHPTERPIEMMEEILRVFCPPHGRILVPFLGSGNTLLAASNMGAEAFGYDLSDKYYDRYVVKVNEQEPGRYSSY